MCSSDLMFASSRTPDKSLFGYRYYDVLTGSMEPAYSVGDLIFVKITDADNINVGDAPGNGYEVVSTLHSKGVSTGSEPKPFAVFSWSNSGNGHTGIILGIQNGEYIVGHASCSYEGKGEGTGGNGTSESRGGGSGFVIKSSNLVTALLGGGGTQSFAYPTVDTNKISQYLQTGE